MSGQRAAAEPYTTRFETEVAAVDGRQVWLETSFFYAGSGGQPSDRGRIADATVEDVQFVGGEHVHVLAEEPRFRAGKRVVCSVDWSYRMYCMRAHTASHVLYGAGRRLLEDLEYAGFDIGEETVRVDLETSTELDDELLVELDRLLNQAVWESRPVSWDSIPATDAREREDLAFEETTEKGVLSRGRVRVVTIGAEDDKDATDSRDPWDVAVCGGTHVRNTREVGPATVLGRSEPREGITRLEFTVGSRAIERREAEKRATFAVEAALGVCVEEIPEEVRRVRSQRDTLADELESAHRALLEARLERVESTVRDGERWLVTTCRGLTPDVLSEVIGAFVDDLTDVDVVVVVGQTEYTFAVVGSSGDTSAEAVVVELTTEFGGGGSGSRRLAQGGGFDASPEQVADSLE